jgi:seryl-tRNA synthetase
MAVRTIENQHLAAARIEPAHFYTAVCHASPNISSVKWNNQRTAFTIDFNGSEQELDGLIDLLKQKIGRPIVNAAPAVTYVREADAAAATTSVWEDLCGTGMITDFGEGHVALGGLFLELVERLDSALRKIAAGLKAQPVQLPNMVPLTCLKQAGIFEQHPDQLFFATPLVSDVAAIENFQTAVKSNSNPSLKHYLSDPQYCLKTSACSFLYPMLKDRDFAQPAYFTMLGACTRHEAKGTNSLERLTEFNMREIVFLGNEQGAQEFQQFSLDLFRDLLEWFDLGGRIAQANDSFFISNYSRLRLMQLLGSEKFEAQVLLPGTNAEIAIGSFNHHRQFFSRRFGFSYSGAPAVTACIGFGLERLVYALFCRHGVESTNLPAMIDRFLEHSLEKQTRKGAYQTAACPK